MSVPPEPVNSVNAVNSINVSQPLSTKVNANQPLSTAVNQDQRDETRRFRGDLSAAIREWVKESTGSFTVADVDREFGLVDRKDKQRRSTCLKRLREENLINKDRRAVGRWHVNTVELEFVDLEAADEAPFPIRLPLDLDSQVSIPPKAIIVLAGSSNSGKTAAALNLLRLNFDEGIPLMYLMSEMGPTEYRQRVELFEDPLTAWSQNVKAASLSANFHGAIAQHNPNGLTVVDYLEEVEGEYYKIPSDIRAIYDALRTGIALVILQKRAGAAFGSGGEKTQEKSRLYLSLDTLLHQPRCAVCALKIIKAKSYPGENPNGKERHFKIIKGHQLVPLSGWMYCNEKQRAAWVTKYQHDQGKR